MQKKKKKNASEAKLSAVRSGNKVPDILQERVYVCFCLDWPDVKPVANLRIHNAILKSAGPFVLRLFQLLRSTLPRSVFSFTIQKKKKIKSVFFL